MYEAGNYNDKSYRKSARIVGDVMGKYHPLFTIKRNLIVFVFMKGPKVTFKDVAGINEAKEELYEIVDFLMDPHKFQKLGGRIMNVTGDPIDEMGDINADRFSSIYNPAPEFVDQSTDRDILITGIKVIDSVKNKLKELKE